MTSSAPPNQSTGSCNVSGDASHQPLKLLPPSSFEVTSKANPWQELASATAQVLDLRQQNQLLRECRELKSVVGSETHAVPAHHQLDGVINRQAAELSELKQRIQTTEGQYQRQVARLESQILIKDAEKKQETVSLRQEMTSLQQEIEKITAQHQTEISQLKENHSQLLEEEVKKRTSLESAFRTQIDNSDASVTELKKQLESVKQEYSSYMETSQQQNSEYEKRLKEQAAQIEQHRRYISETEETSKSSQVYRNNIDTLTNQLQILQSEKESLESSIQLLNVRLKSQNDIHLIQEEQLSQVKESSTEKKRAVLLTRWREKVFQLLVQLESAHITMQDIERKHSHKIWELENELEQEKKSSEILEHRLTDLNAQLQLEKNSLQTVQTELTCAQELAIQLDDRNKQYQATISSLVDYVNSMYEKYCITAKSLQHVQSQLDAYSKRITFASGRVEMLQSQFARREAMLRVELEEQKPTRDQLTVEEGTSSSDPVTENSATDTVLRLELERVQRERDSLAAQIMQDAQTLEERVKTAKLQVNDEVEQLRNRTLELHETIDTITQKLEETEKLHATSQSENQQLKSTIEELRTELAKSHDQLERANDGKEETLRLTEQLTETERKLNDTRREQAKTVVSLRQCQRQSDRDKQRFSEERQRLDQQYSLTVERLNQRVKALETERNLLMTTLRQEGLIGKYKENRSSPIQLEDQEPTATVMSEHSEFEPELPATSHPIQQGSDIAAVFPLTSSRDTFFEDSGEEQHVEIHATDAVDPAVALEQLQHLSEEVLQDSDEENQSDSS